MISNNDQRVIVDNAGTWSDITKEVNSYRVGSADVSLAVGDYIYFGSFLPFNNKYFEFVVGNSTASTMALDIYDGSKWVPVVDYLDYTESNGAGLAQNGTLQFNKDIDDCWQIIDRTDRVAAFNGGPLIFGKYWARISFDQPTSLTMRYVGSLFATHEDLIAEYPSLANANLIGSWEEDKEDWLDQMVIASEYVIADLKKRGIIVERSQVVEQSVLMSPTIHRAAQIIFNGLGPKNYAEQLKESARLYTEAMNLKYFEQDVNGDGQKARFESFVDSRRVSR